MALSTSHRPPPAGQRLDASLRGYLASNADIVTRITKPVHLDDIGALSAQSDQPILFENIVEKPGFRLCDILVKNRRAQARALGTTPENFLRTLAYRLLRLIRGTKALAVLFGLLLVALAWVGASWTGLETLSWVRNVSASCEILLRRSITTSEPSSSPTYPRLATIPRTMRSA